MRQNRVPSVEPRNPSLRPILQHLDRPLPSMDNTSVRPSCCERSPMPASPHVPDAAGRFGPFGGRYVPETLTRALDELTAEYEKAVADQSFHAELADLYRHYVGRPSPLYHARRLSEQCGGAQIYLKREDLNHTGAHKINNTLGQALLTRRMGKPPRDRRDRRRAARRGHRHRLRPVRPGMRRLHGRGRHPPAAAQRVQHEAARRRSPAGRQRLADPARRDQRGLPRLDGLGRDDALLPRLGRRAASVSADRPRLPVGHRPRDPRGSASNRSAGCPT